jgi:hypothetical protein
MLLLILALWCETPNPTPVAAVSAADARLGLDLYQYVRNNPLNVWDPSGLHGFQTTGDLDLDQELQEKFSQPSHRAGT